VGTESGAFVEVQGTAERRPFSEEKLIELLALAQKGLKKLATVQEDVLRPHLSGVDTRS
jgi:ribonuclease PH